MGQRKDVACFLLSVGLRISCWVSMRMESGVRASVQLLWERASHYQNRKYARDPHCDADRYPPGKLRWEDSWNPDFKLESPEPSQGTAILLMEWKRGGRRDERKKIFVAKAYLTFLSGRPMNSVSCQGDVVKMQTADPWSQNSRGVVCARGPLIFPPFDLSLMQRKAFMCGSHTMGNLVHSIMKKQEVQYICFSFSSKYLGMYYPHIFQVV